MLMMHSHAVLVCAVLGSTALYRVICDRIHWQDHTRWCLCSS